MARGLTLISFLMTLMLAGPANAGDDGYEPPDIEDGKEDKEKAPAKGEDGVGYAYDGDDDASTVRARREPYTRRCKDLRGSEDERRRRLDNVDYVRGHLGGEHTRRAWKDLVKLGLEGCDAVADWLNAGGPGGEAADHADAGYELILYGRTKHLQAGATWLGDPSPRVAGKIARGLRERLVVLDAAGVDRLITAFHGDDDAISSEVLLGVLVGYYTTTHTYTTYVYSNGVSIPVTNTYTVWHYAAGEPPATHVAGLREVISGAGNKWADDVAQTLRARCIYKGGEDQDPWAPALMDLIQDAGRAEEVVDKAAHALGWMQPKGSDTIANTLLDGGEGPVQMAYLKGLRSRAKKGYGDENTLYLMSLFQEAGDPVVARAAKKWTRAFTRKLGG